ncbi:hypothetical protein Bca101_059158 [Brassica carinata]
MTNPNQRERENKAEIQRRGDESQIKAGQDCVIRTTHLPESEAGQDGALGVTACQRHSLNIGNQAPVTDPASLTESLTLKEKGKKRERDHSASLFQSSCWTN